MNHVRRRLVLGLVGALAVGAAACADATKVDVEGVERVEITSERFVDLPPSPVGDWPIYNWVWLRDGSGFVHAGAARVDGDGRVTTTPAAAQFSFEQGRYESLPDLPVTAGMGVAAGTRVGDRLVIMGQDCPPSPGSSMQGVEFCADGGMGSKVVLVHDAGASTWRRVDVPDWMSEYDYGTPTIVGAIADGVLATSGNSPAHLGLLDPATGDWRRLADAPDPAALVCSFDGATFAYVAQQYTGWAADGSPLPPRNEWWRLGDAGWAVITPPVPEAPSQTVCTSDGIAIQGADTASYRRTIWWYDGGAPPSAVATDTPYVVESPMTFGSLVAVSPDFRAYLGSAKPSMDTTTTAVASVGSPDTTVAVSTTIVPITPSTIGTEPPTNLAFIGLGGIVEIDVERETWSVVVGRYVVRPNDQQTWGRDERDAPEVLAVE